MNADKRLSPYGTRSGGGGHGDVYTSPLVVSYMLDLVGYVGEADLRDVHILEPSCGDGEFVVEIARRLMQSAARHHFDACHAFTRNVRAYDIDAAKVERCRARLGGMGINHPDECIMAADFLKCQASKSDIVVGNPPYVRYEHIPADMLAYCREHFGTFHYRSDLYVPFYEKSLSLLSPGGKHCFICSNRWLKNEYGRKLRQLVADHYAVRTIIDLGQADVFQEEVLAYPSITVIDAAAPSSTFDYAEVSDVHGLPHATMSRRTAPRGDDWTPAFLPLPSGGAFTTIEQQGFKIGIGVATGADSVFVSSRLPGVVESELLLPGICARDLRGDRLNWHGEYLLNPYNPDGSLVDLASYPLADAYLARHKERLAARHVARKSPSRWYRTIDRINPALLTSPKILLPDMSGNTFVFVDDGAFYPLHNIYYITGSSSVKLRLLAAFLMSGFVRRQLAAVTNAMNGGYPRWQSQHLRKLRLPDFATIPADDVQCLLASYERRDATVIDEIIDNRLCRQTVAG